MTAASDVLVRRLALFALSVIVALGGALAGAPRAAAQTIVYSNDFSVAAGPEWSPSMTVFTLPLGERMLGDPFGNITESLTLVGLPSHTDVTISFDLYVLRSWDGNGEFGFGPDFWGAGVSGGPTLQPTTTFANPGCSGFQSYPSPYPAVFPPTTGAAAVGTLGYGVGCFGDSTYHFSFTFPHTASSIGFDFTGSGLQRWADEGWGLDNVVVEVTRPRVPQHFKAYELAQPERFIEEVTLIDQFDTHRVRVEEPEMLLTPVEKRRTGREPTPIERPGEHLVCYGLGVSAFPERTAVVSNQFVERSTLTIGRPKWLCAPASKTLEGAPGPPPSDLDHYLCYDVRTESPRFPSETLGLSDQLHTETARIDRTREHCNPVEKRRDGREAEPIKRPKEHLVCYRIVTTSPLFTARDVFTLDQFGSETLHVVSPRRLCVPSSKEDAPPVLAPPGA